MRQPLLLDMDNSTRQRTLKTFLLSDTTQAGLIGAIFKSDALSFTYTYTLGAPVFNIKNKSEGALLVIEYNTN